MLEGWEVYGIWNNSKHNMYQIWFSSGQAVKLILHHAPGKN